MYTLKRSLALAGLVTLASATGAWAQNISTGEVEQTTGQPDAQEQGGNLNRNELAEPLGTPYGTSEPVHDSATAQRDVQSNADRIYEPVPQVRSNLGAMGPGVHTKNLSGIDQVHNSLGEAVGPGPATVDNNASAGLEESGRMSQ
jgi:hypothetical protein